MLYCTYCGRIIKPLDVWYLYNSPDCYDRRLEIGICPKCKDDVAILFEYDKKTGSLKTTRHYRDKAIALIDKCITQLFYRQRDLINKKGKPYGFIYGENREYKKTSDVVVYACDFFGNKEALKTLSVD